MSKLNGLLQVACALLSVVGAAQAADVAVRPPTQMSCGSNYTTHSLGRVEVALLNGTQQIGTAAINDASATPQGDMSLRVPVSSSTTVNAMRLTCNYDTVRGMVSHALTYQFKSMVWPLQSGDTAVVVVTVRGIVSEGTRAASVDGFEVAAPTNLRTVARVD